MCTVIGHKCTRYSKCFHLWPGVCVSESMSMYQPLNSVREKSEGLNFLLVRLPSVRDKAVWILMPTLKPWYIIFCLNNLCPLAYLPLTKAWMYGNEWPHLASIGIGFVWWKICEPQTLKNLHMNYTLKFESWIYMGPWYCYHWGHKTKTG